MPVIPDEVLMNKIFLIRGKKVMIDEDLSELYGVETKRLNEQVKRNLSRFPDDFMFQLSKEEFTNLKSQIATTSWGGRRTPPYSFTEHGVLMLSSVLNSERAIQDGTWPDIHRAMPYRTSNSPCPVCWASLAQNLRDMEMPLPERTVW